MFVIKHYHIIALFLIFFSVESFYEAFPDGDLERSLWTGIGRTLFALDEGGINPYSFLELEKVSF